ncbi:MAG TPA: hypothetical protein PKE04_16400, partial [Clostridia bacterium]|nr:hypothetical protein [Clostridia bacterium]
MEKGYRFLYDNAKPILKREAAAALSIREDALQAAWLASPEARYWIDCLAQFADRPQVHNADDHCLENAMHKLV